MSITFQPVAKMNECKRKKSNHAFITVQKIYWKFTVLSVWNISNKCNNNLLLYDSFQVLFWEVPVHVVHKTSRFCSKGKLNRHLVAPGGKLVDKILDGLWLNILEIIISKGIQGGEKKPWGSFSIVDDVRRKLKSSVPRKDHNQCRWIEWLNEFILHC